MGHLHQKKIILEKYKKTSKQLFLLETAMKTLRQHTVVEFILY